MIQEASKYNESIGEWQIKNVAFTGNNMQRVSKIWLLLEEKSDGLRGQDSFDAMDQENLNDSQNFESVYLSYKH